MGGRVVSFASIDLQRTSAIERTVTSIGAVTIYGLSELQDAGQRRASFIEAWRDAICFEIGSEEFEKFCALDHKPPPRFL